MAQAFYIPVGVKNLEALFPDIDFNSIAEYYVEVKDLEGTVVATTAIAEIGGCCEDDKVRIHFLNTLGAIDAINFKRVKKEHESKSESWQNPESYPLQKTEHAINRFNVKSNKTYTAKTIDYTEDDQDWLDELFDSPLAWIQWAGTQGQPDSFLPIKILDSKRETVKEQDRFTYEVTIEFILSHERFTIRN